MAVEQRIRRRRVWRRLQHGLIAATAIGFVLPTSGQQPHSVDSTLDAYHRGNYSAAAIVAQNESDFAEFRRALEDEGPAWVNAAGPQEATERRHVLCAFVLEWLFANANYWTDRSQNPLTAYWAAGPAQFDPAIIDGVDSEFPSAVEWAWEQSRDAPSSDFDDAWAFAAIVLLWDVGHYEFYLFDAPYFPTDLHTAAEQRYGVPLHFLERVRAKFPDDPRLALRASMGSSIGIDQELANRIGQHHEVPYAKAIEAIRRGTALEEAQRLDSRDLEFGIADRHLLNESDGLSILDRVAKSLVPFRSVPQVRADADLYLGMIAICFAQHDDARKLFDELEQSQPTPCQAYHARFLRGRVDEEDGRIEDAERDYRQALAIIPSAQSSVSSLASLLSLHDRQSEAAALLQQELTQPIQDDPWGWVLSAPCPQWPEAIAAVRAALK